MTDLDLGTYLALRARPGLSADLARTVQGQGAPRSVALVGLPGFLLDEQFRLFEKVATSAERTFGLLHVRSGDLKLRGPRQVLMQLAERLTLDPTSLNDDLSAVLPILQKRAIELIHPPKKLILCLADLHELSESTATSDVRHLLDFLQVAATEDTPWLAVACSSHVVPARVCVDLGWSPFYKVFGIRVYYAGLLDGAAGEAAIASLLAERGINVGDGAPRRLMDLSHGVPDVLVELLHRVLGGDGASSLERPIGETVCLDDLRSNVRRELAPDAIQFFERRGWASTSDRDRSPAREALRLGLLRQAAADSLEPTLAAPWEAPVLVAGAPTTVGSEDATPFVHGDYLLRSHHRALVRRACAGTHYTRLEVLQDREGEAVVVRLNREGAAGELLRPRIVKLDDVARLRKEAERAHLASELLGQAAPRIVDSFESGTSGAIVVELACADGRSYSVATLEDVFRAAVSSDRRGDSFLLEAVQPDPVSLLRRLLGNVLAPLYRDAKPVQRRLAHVYPALKDAELQDLSDLSVQLLGPASAGTAELTDIGSRLQRVGQDTLRRARPVRMCERIHGDLNPRNALLDGANNIHVIDFASFADGPLCKDFVRLECEVLFRLTPPQPVEVHHSLLPLLLEGEDPVAAARRVKALPLSPDVRMAMACVLAIRETCAGHLGAPFDATLAAEFCGGLAATAARLALMVQYLSNPQRAGALIYAGLAIGRLRDVDGLRGD